MAEEMKEARERLSDIYYRYHPPLKTSFLEDLEWSWGGRWGADTEVGRLRKVLLHRPGREMDAVKEPYEEWRYDHKPDLEEMLRDYEVLKGAFEEEGVEVVERRPEEGPSPRLVKSIYTRDPAFAVPGGVVVGRMYDRLRRGEERYTMQTLAEIGCPILRVANGSATVEGGSVMWLGPKHLAIGLSWRVNEEGATQVAEVVWPSTPRSRSTRSPSSAATSTTSSAWWTSRRRSSSGRASPTPCTSGSGRTWGSTSSTGRGTSTSRASPSAPAGSSAPPARGRMRGSRCWRGTA